MVGMPGFWPGFLALDRRTGGGVGGGGGGGGKRNTVLQFNRDRKIQFYSSIGVRRFTREKSSF